METREIGERIEQHLAETLSPEEYARMFSPEGLARQCLWDCEDGWMVGYTTARIRHGRNDGKFAWFTYKPIGKGARSGDAENWVRKDFKVTATMKTARKRAEAFYYKHSPKIAARHGVAT